MSSPFRSIAVAAAFLTVLACTAPAAARALRVCADPNNMPFSNERQEGFENKLAALLAKELHAELQYTWWAGRRGFLRNTLKAGVCDVVPGAVAGAEGVRTTRPYYRSRYVFVTRSNDGLRPSSFDDPLLQRLTIGVQLVGDDGGNPPAAHALARRGLAANLRGYTVYGDYSRPDPAGQIVAAVAAGDVDAAVVWGPFAGYFAPRQTVALSISAGPDNDGPRLPLVFDIAMAVRTEDRALRDEIDAVLHRRHADVAAILADYGILPDEAGAIQRGRP
jgi:mxaJ protein